MSGNDNQKARKMESDALTRHRNKGNKDTGSWKYDNSLKTPAKMIKRDIEEVDPNSPFPQRSECILKLKESELFVQIKRIVTEVIQKELKTKVEELEVKVDSNT